MDTPHQFPAGRKSTGGDNGFDRKSVVVFYSVSFLLHLLVILAMVYIENFSSSIPRPPAIRVDLVSFSPFPGKKSSSLPAASEVQSDSPGAEPEIDLSVDVTKTPMDLIPEPEILEMPEDESLVEVPDVKESEPVVEKIIDAPPEPQVEQEIAIPVLEPSADLKKKSDRPKIKEPPQKKSSLKGKTYKPEKVLASAKRRIEQSVKKKDEDTLTKALSRLQKRVDSSAKQGGVGGSPSGRSSKGSIGGGTTSHIDLYNLEIMYRIRQNWVFNERLAGADNNLEVRILIKVLKDGSIRDILFETRSGNAYLDDSAFKAIKKSSPLSPLPKGYNSYDVGLIFTPSGLK